MLLGSLRKRVLKVANMLERYNLITLTGGNVSARDEKTGYICITPSGMMYEDMTTMDIVVMDEDMNVIEGTKKASTDILNHIQMYQARKDLGGIIHTHSYYASCFALLGESIPVCQTTMANEIGGEVPVCDYAVAGTRELGENIVSCMGEQNAVLIQNHGVYAYGKNVEHALQAAVMIEDAAKTYYLARSIGKPTELDEEAIKAAADIFKYSYGQDIDESFARNVLGDDKTGGSKTLFEEIID